MKVTKTKLILSVALFLLLFPFAAGYRYPTRRLTGRQVIDISHVGIYFNGYIGYILHDGNLTAIEASTNSEEFKQYFIENLTAINSEFPEVELNISSWHANISTVDIKLKWIYNLTDAEKLEVRHGLIDVFSSQWYTLYVDCPVVIGDVWYWETTVPPYAEPIAAVCWSALFVLTASFVMVWYWRKIQQTKGEGNIMEAKQ